MSRKNTPKADAKRGAREATSRVRQAITDAGSVTCDKCGNSVPARLDDHSKPSVHYLGDGKTWCK